MNIREIARIAGVSHSTVSRALRNNPHISKSTRERIQKIAREHGYRPHPMVSKLMTQLPHVKTRARSTLALLTCWKNWQGVDFLNQTYRGIADRSHSLGYNLEEFSLYQYDRSVERLNHVLKTRGIEGVLIFPFDREHRELELDWQSFASVYIGRFLSHPAINRVSTSYYANMRLALRQLQALGYKRIALALTAEMCLRSEDAYLAAYSCYERDIPVEQHIPILLATSVKSQNENQPIQPGNYTTTTNLDSPGTLAWLRHHRADALICNSSPALDTLLKGGFRVPEDIGYVSLDRSNTAPHLSGIDQQPALLGSAAVDMLTAHLNRNEFGMPESPKILTLHSLWHPGKTAIQQ